MDLADKTEKLPEDSEDESIDLSAGFVLKSTSAPREAQQAVATGGEAKPIDGKTGLTWRWAAEADMPVLELLNFEAEIEAGRGMFLPELSFPGAIAVCERNGKIIGGVFAEESTTMTLIGADAAVLESAGDFIVPACVNLARKSGTRLVHSALPTPFAGKLSAALQGAGFKPAEPEAVSYQMEVKPEDSSSARRKHQ